MFEIFCLNATLVFIFFVLIHNFDICTFKVFIFVPTSLILDHFGPYTFKMSILILVLSIFVYFDFEV